jgi:ketosteroid isomerase-like protein
MIRAYAFTAAFFIIAAAAVVFGQATNKPRASGEDAAATIAVMDHIWLDAAHNRDTGTLEWLFADDFVEVHPGGFIVNKQEQIAQIADPQRVLNEIHPDDIQVRYVSPDVAVLTDTTTIKGTSGGVRYDGPQRVIRVFVKQNGRWRRHSAHRPRSLESPRRGQPLTLTGQMTGPSRRARDGPAATKSRGCCSGRPGFGRARVRDTRN